MKRYLLKYFNVCIYFAVPIYLSPFGEGMPEISSYYYKQCVYPRCKQIKQVTANVAKRFQVECQINVAVILNGLS